MKNKSKNKTRIKNDSKISYGTYTGRLLSDLPAKYIHHLWTNGQFAEMRNGPSILLKTGGSAVWHYVEANKAQLNREYPSKEW